VDLNNGWQYRTGDSPKDSTGNFIWLDKNYETDRWTSITDLNKIPVSDSVKSIWLRIQLKDLDIQSPALYLTSIRQSAQIYLDNNKIYEYGEFVDIESNHFKGWRSFVIPLPDNYSNRMLTFRIWSSDSPIGLGMPVFLGATDDILNNMFIRNLDEIIFASLFLFLGVVLFVMFLSIQRNMFFFGLFLFIISNGIFTASNSIYLQTVIYAPRIFFIFDILSLLTASVGGMILFEQIIIEKFKPVVRKLWQLYVVILAISIYPVISLDFSYTYLLNQFLMPLAIISMAISFILILMSLRKGGTDLILLFIGNLIFYVFAGFEIFFFYDYGNDLEFGLRIGWLHIGTFVFVIFLIWIVIRKYFETDKQKETAQKNATESLIKSERFKSQMQLKQVEAEKLKELDQMKSRFFANISHEFRTPLTLILGPLQNIIEKTDDGKSKQQFRTIEHNANHLLKLINEMLDLSKLDFKEMKLQVAEKDIVSYLKILIESFDSFVRAKKVSLEYLPEMKTLNLYYDPEKIQKIIYNLLSNAIKFTEAGGFVKVEVKECRSSEKFKNGSIKIIISDNGIGIVEEHLPNIFDRFYQINNQKTYVNEGSGIGLALVKELVTLHYGDICVTSKEGGGTTFIIKLPLGKDHFKENEIVNTPAYWQYELNPGLYFDNAELKNRKRTLPDPDKISEDETVVLIIEDNPDLRAFIADSIEPTCTIVEATNGLEGIESALSLIPDLIISDIMMPEADGYEVCRTLKSDERTSHVPIILLTAKAELEDKIKGFEYKVDDYLVKPFNKKELNVRLKNLIELRKTLIEKFNNSNLSEENNLNISILDKQFITTINTIIDNNLDNADYSIDSLSGELGMSPRNLRRKMNQLLGVSPNQYIRTLRLERAKQMLLEKRGNITEIALETGFSSSAYFSKCFQDHFGKSPSYYTKQQ
jgi:signal transduction histidine kinase/DNA-binding response OmpR family regulator